VYAYLGKPYVVEMCNLRYLLCWCFHIEETMVFEIKLFLCARVSKETAKGISSLVVPVLLIYSSFLA
jgi:hypothetical protein